MADLMPWVVGYLLGAQAAAMIVVIQAGFEWISKPQPKKSCATYIWLHVPLIFFLAATWPMWLLSKLYKLRSKDSHEQH